MRSFSQIVGAERLGNLPSDAPHLHFQLHVGDVTQNPVEFFEYLSYLRPYD